MIAKVRAFCRAWKWRSFVSYFLLFSGIVLIVSGVVLYVAPSGRVAHSTDWHLLWMDKAAWESVHTNAGYVSIFFGIVHLLLNWKVLLHYLWNRTRRAHQLKSEIVVSLALTLVVLLGSAWDWPVFSDVMTLGETFQNAWEDDTASAAVVHIEEQDTVTAEEATTSEEMPTASPATVEVEEEH